MSQGNFVHLHCHTHYSLLDGANRIPELVEQTKKLGMTAASITDHGNLYGAIEFYKECKDKGINPVVGYEAYLAPNSRFDKKAGRQGDAYSHLTLLAKNTTGFKNLVKLSSIAFLEGFYYHPRIDREVLEAHKEGLICLSGCLAGEFNDWILKGKPEKSEEIAAWFSKLFGNDFYIEIQNNGLDLQDTCTVEAVRIAEKMGFPLVATADAHYLCQADAEAHDVLFCINTGKKRDPIKKSYPEGRMPNPYYVRSPQDMYNLFPKFPDAVKRSQEIADAVHIDIDFKKRHFPVFTPPNNQSCDQFLREICLQGVQFRYGDNPSKEVLARLEHELGIICRMGFASYFLIVWDFVRFALENGIPASARGSGCGAIVSYVLQLSHVDPLTYDLLFERFLDPNRSEAPDIDIDFCQEGREEVIAYVKRKYGENSVAQIATFGTLAAKAALKDVGRVLDIPLERVNFMCKLVPMKGAIALSLDDAMQQSPEFKREYDTDPTVKQWVDIALKLEGTNRNAGTHAAGVVIANGPITDYVPVQVVNRKDDTNGDRRALTTQWVMGDLEKVGMLKMDFLGLRTLTLVEHALRLIKKTRGDIIDVQKLPLDDAETYKMLQKGDAKGVFQFESEGIRELLKRMKPDNIRDIIASTALYRPGPLEGGMVDEYIDCKHGRKKPEYPHAIVEEVLSETYGVMCIHEDTRVAMADGTEKAIKHVRAFDRVHSMNPETLDIEVRECHGCGPTRREDGLRLTLENGFSVMLTRDHKVWTWGGWKQVQELDPATDLVACGLHARQELPEVCDLAPWLGTDEDVAYLMGYLTGDGWLTGSGIIIASGIEANHRRLVPWIAERFPSLRIHEYFKTRSWYISLSHPELHNDPACGNRKTRFHHFLEKHGLKCKASEKRVPEAIFRCPAPVRSAYLAGLLDSDGCIATNKKGVGVCFISSTSPGMLQDLRRLMQLEGVALKFYAHRVQVWSVARLRDAVEPYLVLKRFPSDCPSGSAIGWVPRAELFAAIPAGESRRRFSARTGIERRGMLHDFPFVKSSTARKAGIELGDVRFYRIGSVEVVPAQQFYGMSVAEHHSLLANGVVVKNCYQEQVMRMLNRLGGIELSSAYACIKAISKKKYDIIDARKVDFVKGAKERGLDGKRATDIFDLIVKFGGYGFNKCVVGETVIVDAKTGERTTVEELFRGSKPFTIHALNDEGKLVPRRVEEVMWNGVKPVYELRTVLGKRIRATANHPFRTLDGWTNLSELQVGDRIAVPRDMRINSATEWPDYQLITLAGLLSEGNTCHPSTLYFYGNERSLVDDFAAAIRQFPNTKSRVYTRPDGRFEVAANTGEDTRFQRRGLSDDGVVLVCPPKIRSGAFAWAGSLGILGRKATVKQVPEAVFVLSDRSVELFLGRLWAGDGFISNQELHVPFYATSSEQLAGDVQSLLLRLGIVSRIHRKSFKYRGTRRPGYTVHVLGENSTERFLTRIAPHCLSRDKAVGLLQRHLQETARGRTSKDTLPPEVREWINRERQVRGLTWLQLQEESGVCVKELYGKGSERKKGFRRETVRRLGAHLQSSSLQQLGESDLFWDRIESIESVGEFDTYDLTVEVDHNFVADGIVVHNSHSAAYAHVSYQTAYLKRHYTPEFFAALLSSEIDDGNKRDMLVDHIGDAKRLGVPVLPPDVNQGEADFAVLNNQIVFGLTAIKGVGRGAAEEIVRVREESGKFKDLYDFCERIDTKTVSKAAMEKLIKAGAMDGFANPFAHRAQLMIALTNAIQSAEVSQSDRRRGQANLFADLESSGGFGAETTPLPTVERWVNLEQLKYEKEALDFYFSSHPLAEFDADLQRFATHQIGDLRNLEHGQEVRIGGMISQVKQRTTKRGDPFLVFMVEDFSGSVGCFMWSNDMARYKSFIVDDAIFLLEGSVDYKDREDPQLQMKKVISLDTAKKELTKGMILRMGLDNHGPDVIDGISRVLKRAPGPCVVYLQVRDGAGRKAQFRLGDDFKVHPGQLKVDELEMLLGTGSIVFTGR